MIVFDPAAAAWLVVAAPAVGLVCAWIVRKSAGSPRQVLWQRLFYGALLLVGAASMAGTAVGPGCWLACSAALPLMLLTATCDVGAARRASVLPEP